MTCKEIRHGAEGEGQQDQVIEMAPFWQDQLKEFPQFISKLLSQFIDHSRFYTQDQKAEC
jgi:hypothetical protein